MLWLLKQPCIYIYICPAWHLHIHSCSLHTPTRIHIHTYIHTHTIQHNVQLPKIVTVLFLSRLFFGRIFCSFFQFIEIRTAEWDTTYLRTYMGSTYMRTGCYWSTVYCTVSRYERYHISEYDAYLDIAAVLCTCVCVCYSSLLYCNAWKILKGYDSWCPCTRWTYVCFKCITCRQVYSLQPHVIHAIGGPLMQTMNDYTRFE